MLDSKMLILHRWFIFVLVGVVLSMYYTLQRLYIDQQRLRRSMFEEFIDESENDTATHMVMEHLNAQIKQTTYLSKVKTVIETTNSAETVFNDHLYSGLNNDNLVIVVRVHKAHKHLHHLISSLSKVFGCNKLFVIFIHDCNDEQINRLVKNIAVFKYMQFYYPYACKIFLNSFPGEDPNFCYDSYICVENFAKRNASLVQQKHLWWWTLNRVFRLDVMKRYSKYVLFVDEHSYFAEDLVYLMRLLELALSERCPDCMMMNFVGHSPSVLHYDSNIAYVSIEPFGSGLTNGFAFNRTTWNKMKVLKQSYCYFNDYSWIESLKKLIQSASDKFWVFSSVGSRVFDTSKCEATFQNLTCEFDGVKMNMTTFMPLVKGNLFPPNVIVIPKDMAEVEVLQRGGWEDIRDKDLCIFLASKAKSALFFRLNWFICLMKVYTIFSYTFV